MNDFTKEQYLKLLHWIYGGSDVYTEAIWEDAYATILDDAIASIPSRHAEVLRNRVRGLSLRRVAELTPRIQAGIGYGLDGHVGCERIRQMEARALRMMRHPKRLTLNRYIEKKYFCELKETGETKTRSYEIDGIKYSYEKSREKCGLCARYDDEGDDLLCPAKSARRRFIAHRRGISESRVEPQPKPCKMIAV